MKRMESSLQSAADAASLLAVVEDAFREASDLSWVRPANLHGLGPNSCDCAHNSGASVLAFPGFQVLKTISSGGQAVVYLAVEDSTEKNVAIKVFRTSSRPTPRERYRFEREVEALQGVRHPNIVRVLHATAEAECPYLVMDFVPGWNLDDYLREHDLNVRTTLQLFHTIALAVNAAHQRGVIHRDLKPSNIRVDHNGEPHVFDFGLAKVANASSDALSSDAMTQPGQFLGTMHWVSPEQAEGRLQDVDIRTDVYALGLLLHYMLTGRMALDESGSMRDVLNRIATAEPSRPSSFRPNIDDDVDTIVLKCLSKASSRRYESAGALAQDVQLWLDEKAISAKRDSWGYRLRMVVRRHPTGFSVALLMTLGVFALLWQARQAQVQARAFLEAKYNLSRMEIEQITQGKMPAQDVAERLRKVSSETARLAPAQRHEILQSLAGLCVTWQLPQVGMEIAREELRNAKSTHGEHSQQHVEALMACARMALDTNDLDTAKKCALESTSFVEQIAHPSGDLVSQIYRSAAFVFCAAGDLDAAERGVDACIPLEREVHGAAPAGLSGALKADADQYRAIATKKSAQGLDVTSVLAKAERYARESVTLGETALADRQDQLSHCLTTLAAVLRDQGNMVEAEKYAVRALVIRRQCYASPESVVQWIWLHSSMETLANIYRLENRFVEAEALLTEAIREVIKYNPTHEGIRAAQRSCRQSLAKLYDVWDRTEPGSGFDIKAAEQRALGDS